MPQAMFNIVSQEAAFDRLPLIIRQKSSKNSGILLVLMLIPTLFAVILPFSFVAAHAAQDPAVATAIWNKPVAALQILVGLLLWAIIFLIPLTNLVTRLGRERMVRIQAGHVYVTDRHMFFRRKWVQPLTAFRGIAHNVRATHSGPRQELILVHKDKRRSLLLHTADQVNSDLIDKATSLLALPQLPSRDLYFSFTARFAKSSAIHAPLTASVATA